MTALRIIHVASGREWRGGQRQVLHLARGLTTAPHIETSVITGAGTPLAERLESAGVTVHGVTWSMGLDPRVVRRLLAELGPRVIVHAHDNHAHTLADAAIRIKDARVVVTRRVDFPIRHAGRWRRADHAIALSSSVRTRLVAAGVSDSRISVIPPAVDLDALSTCPPWPAAARERDGSAPFIVCVAALTPEKGVDVLLDAAARLRASHPDLEWIVLGDGSQRQPLLARRRALGLDDVVSFPGHVEHPEAVVARAAILVQPSRSEGFGSSVLDALALGVPVLASDTGGLPESLAQGGGLLVKPGNAEDLAQSVSELLGDSGRRERLGRDGRVAADSFAVPRLVSRTLDVYRSLAMTETTK
jgi:glycosyltransferase involved in cell wall biosynthesis